MKQIHIESYFRIGYTCFMNYVSNVTNHFKRRIIEEKLKIVEG